LSGLLWTIGAHAATEEPHRHFLVVYSAHPTLVANTELAAGLGAALDRALEANYEIFAEYRDDQRFPGPEADVRFADEMRRKYGGQRFDAILAVGASALAYAGAHRRDFAGAPPIVFGGVGEAVLARMDLPRDAYGIRTVYSVLGTLDLARALQPGAKCVVVLTGSGAYDRVWDKTAREALDGVDDLAVDYATEMTLAGFADFAARLDPDSILLILTVFQDAAGQDFTPVNAAEIIARASAAPSYGVYDTYVGRGVVGGDVQRFRDIGAAMAELALRLAAGEAGFAAMTDVPARLVVDWRQMQRFGLDRALLPPGTLLEHYEPTAFERYRVPVLLACAVIFAQAATIAALVVQDRRRRGAERELGARQVELAHMSRIVQLGELSGAVAHELNQPLTSILANAEAGAALARRDPADIAEIAAILDDIAEDDRRAAGIIVELRRLMTKGETTREALDLDTVVAATIALARSEFLVRRVKIEHRPARGALTVRASRPQLKQVILNLLLNAADAMADQPIETRVVTVTTRRRDDGWRELAVEDRGPGLPAETAADPFRPFATTKATGLGLGLSICRTIVQGHRGTLAFDPGRTRGARVVLALPPPCAPAGPSISSTTTRRSCGRSGACWPRPATPARPGPAPRPSLPGRRRRTTAASSSTCSCRARAASTSRRASRRAIRPCRWCS
jgi:signal transduction histidine kinase